MLQLGYLYIAGKHLLPGAVWRLSSLLLFSSDTPEQMLFACLLVFLWHGAHRMLTKGMSVLFTLAHECQEELLNADEIPESPDCTRWWVVYSHNLEFTWVNFLIIIKMQTQKVKLLEASQGQQSVHHLDPRIHEPGLRTTLKDACAFWLNNTSSTNSSHHEVI